MGTENEAKNEHLDAEFDFAWHEQVFARRAARRQFFSSVRNGVIVLAGFSGSTYALFTFLNRGMSQ